MIEKLFLNLKVNKKNFLKAKTGKDFELGLKDGLTKIGIHQMGLDSFIDIATTKEFKKIKDFITAKNETTFYKSGHLPKEMHNKFIYEPYGSQQYPDFLLITEKYIVPIEVKYSEKENAPMWNSNMPKANGFYILASYGKSDITFFQGSCVLDMPLRKALNIFFDEIKIIQDDFRENKLPLLNLNNKNIMGFKPYIRKAFETSKTFSTENLSNIYEWDGREESENILINTIKDL